MRGSYAGLFCRFTMPPQRLLFDPNITYCFIGSFKTDVVGNPNKARHGQPIDLSDFDADLFIESDFLFSKFAGNPKANPEFRELLSNTRGFEGLRANK